MNKEELVTLLEKLDGALSVEREQATKELYEWLLLVARGLLRSRPRRFAPVAEEIANDIAAELACNPKKRRMAASAEKPVAYVRRMIVNAVIDRFRSPRETRHDDLLPLDELEPASQQDERSAGFQDIVDAADAIGFLWGRMSEEEQDLLVMRFWDDLPIKEIADRLGIGYAAAAQRLHRRVRKLRKTAVVSCPT